MGPMCSLTCFQGLATGHFPVPDETSVHPGDISFNHLKPTGHVMHQQFNIQQLYALPTLYLCVLYLSENKQRLVPLTA